MENLSARQFLPIPAVCINHLAPWNWLKLVLDCKNPTLLHAARIWYLFSNKAADLKTDTHLYAKYRRLLPGKGVDKSLFSLLSHF